MTEPRNALADVLALLAAFERTSWAQCHVRTSALEVFLSRGRDGANPMTGSSDQAQAAVDVADLRTLTAPHVGTLRSILAVGDCVRTGAAYAVIEVLEEPMELVAPCDGVVTHAPARPGDLVEHEQPLLRLRA